jgi:hypothetical protein
MGRGEGVVAWFGIGDAGLGCDGSVAEADGIAAAWELRPVAAIAAVAGEEVHIERQTVVLGES